MTTAAAHINIDGAARGNPGPAAFAFIITKDGKLVEEDKGCLGERTNNVAEYSALIRALERAAKLGERRLVIHSDSELLVKQMNGEYRVKNKDLQALHEQAQKLSSRFESIEFRHVRREQNSHADRLCNEALDGISAAVPSLRAPSRASKERLELAQADALACLRKAAAAWAHGDANHPSVEAVWEQLWSVLEENGLVRPSR